MPSKYDDETLAGARHLYEVGHRWNPTETNYRHGHLIRRPKGDQLAWEVLEDRMKDAYCEAFMSEKAIAAKGGLR